MARATALSTYRPCLRQSIVDGAHLPRSQQILKIKRAKWCHIPRMTGPYIINDNLSFDGELDREAMLKYPDS